MKAIKILGVNFTTENAEGVANRLINEGGLLLVPAAPALITIPDDTEYYDSLLNGDIIIPDSGYMCIIWNLSHKEKIKPLAGPEVLRKFIDDDRVKANSDELFLVNPIPAEEEANINYLNSLGYTLDKSQSYLAPMYGKTNVEDYELLKVLEEKKPKYIIINLGGGTQEKLGLFLKNKLSFKPAIICTGAAIAFFTGRQAKIPEWAYSVALGWLFRCIADPKKFIPRYLSAFPLLGLMAKYGANKVE